MQRKSLIRQQLMQRRLQKMGGSLSVDSVLPGDRESAQAIVQLCRPDADHSRAPQLSDSLGALPPGIGSGLVPDGLDERDEICSPSRMDTGDAAGAAATAQLGSGLVCAFCGAAISHRPPPPAPPLCASCSITAVNQLGLQLSNHMGNPAAMFPFLPLLSLPQVAGVGVPKLGDGAGPSGSLLPMAMPPSTLSLPTGVCRPSRFLDINSAAFNPAMFIPSPIAEERIQTTDFQTGALRRLLCLCAFVQFPIVPRLIRLFLNRTTDLVYCKCTVLCASTFSSTSTSSSTCLQ